MFDEAIVEYLEVLKIDSSHAKALFNMATMHVQLGEDGKAIGYYEKLLEVNPDNGDVWNNLGSIHETLGKYDEAARAYRKSIEINPFLEEANINLARIQYQQYVSNPTDIRKEEIINRLHFVLSINPNQKKARKLLDELNNQRG
jgi:tetratricopeptide (TPR) repeat protein